MREVLEVSERGSASTVCCVMAEGTHPRAPADSLRDGSTKSGATYDRTESVAQGTALTNDGPGSIIAGMVEELVEPSMKGPYSSEGVGESRCSCDLGRRVDIWAAWLT